MLTFMDVHYRYPASGSAADALHGVSLAVAEGELVGVLGSNGSGKSTLVRLANGILLPDSGSVDVDALLTSNEGSIRALRKRVGVVSQHPEDQIVATTVEEDVAFGPENLGLANPELRLRVDSALRAVGLTGLECREPHLLSGGQKQRLVIAGALAMHPSYLVLDEPTSMLDPEGREDVLSVLAELRESGRGILHVTHNLADVADADRIVVLHHGAVAFCGTPDELVGSPGLLEQCGLEVPPFSVMVTRLWALGAPVSRKGLGSADEVAEALWA